MSLAVLKPAPSFSVIALDKFILATRDSGYKGTASALAELVDNAIQAGAKDIDISITSKGAEPTQQLEVRILDDGCGMNPATLRQALRFGGSTRFNDRRGLGRYGMGLPNSSLSQAREVIVYSWVHPDAVFAAHLSVDEIAAGRMDEVPVPYRAVPPTGQPATSTGTLVQLLHCDRLDNRRVATIQRKLSAAFGQTFRYFLWDGVRIRINGEPVEPVDPMFLRTGRDGAFASPYGEDLVYELRSSLEPEAPTGQVHVTFTELPLHKWHALSHDEKRSLGISKGAGVSVVRAGREVDYGWFFMGSKRRENYDDWFRCEVRFDPILDEAFGITHTKQQIRPQQRVLEALSADIEMIAHALNGRVRKSFTTLKSDQRFLDSERLAGERDRLLPPIPNENRLPTAEDTELADRLKRRHPSLQREAAGNTGRQGYRIVEDEVKELWFYKATLVDSQVVAVMNPSHPFHKQLYRQGAEAEGPRERDLRGLVELLVLAAARAELGLEGIDAQLKRFRKAWSDTLAAFLNG